MPEGVDPRDEQFDPRRGPIYVRADGGRAQAQGAQLAADTRRQPATRLHGPAAEGCSAVPPIPALCSSGCWRYLKDLRDGWLASTSDGRLGLVYQVDHTWLRLSPVGPADVMYRCQQCRRLASVSLRGVCTTMGCTGTLDEYTVPDPPRTTATTGISTARMNPVPLSASEHTGQLTSMEAADIQQRFIRGEINALSCSTTFELGVDVGELQSVVLRNMPPTTANYVQRAGRAGRRTESAALVVTYAQRRSHDLSRFQDPGAMVAGEVRAPYVPLANERIDRRHAHSVALPRSSGTARTSPAKSGATAGEFFLPGPGNTAPPSQRVQVFLTPVPDDDPAIAVPGSAGIGTGGNRPGHLGPG